MPDMPVFRYNDPFLKHCSLETTLYSIRIIQYSLGDYYIALFPHAAAAILWWKCYLL
jgi:hypothetical protein